MSMFTFLVPFFFVVEVEGLFFFENISPVYLHGFTLLNNFLWYFGNCLNPGRKL